MIKMIASKLGIEVKKYRPKEINICDKLQLVAKGCGYEYDVFIDGVKQEGVLSIEFKAYAGDNLVLKIERYL